MPWRHTDWREGNHSRYESVCHGPAGRSCDYISKGDVDSEGGDLTGDYNFLTRKFDNGTDPYGWYEDDL